MRTMSNECPICGRESAAGGSLCRYHSTAREHLEKAFAEWKRAQEVTWEQYLDELSASEATGAWVKDVVEHIKSQSGS
jgi:hypothetical protein